MSKWLIEEKSYKPEKELLMETLFTLSNGYMSCRGTLEEGSNLNVKQYFGTYAAGVFDKYNKDYQAIVNLPYLFNTPVYINNVPLDMTKGEIIYYKRYLDMKNGLLTRKFIWDNGKNQKTKFEITRFISKTEPHLAVLNCCIKPLNYNGTIQINNILDGNVTNIDFHISGYQLRDEKYHFIGDKHDKGKLSNGGYLTIQTRKTKIKVCECFKYKLFENNKEIKPQSTYQLDRFLLNNQLHFKVKKYNNYKFFKVISVFTSRDKVREIKKAAIKKADTSLQTGYNQLLDEHKREWNKIWEISNININGNKKDDKNVRFNLFHLIQMGNKNDPYVNIGSRGLTSEMHYGNCFWDTEIFILPFFIYTDPDTAKALLKYRYLTLPEARKKAKQLWFKGAMYPWMSSYPGKEQADYWEYANIAIHVVSDVVYGLIYYFNVTGDMDFMVKYGLEILIETARFWASRSYFNKRTGKYVINTVKGPNEYDGVVNNNTYTNWGARFNLIQAKKIVQLVKKNYLEKYNKLTKKLNFNEKELKNWTDIINKLYINYDKKKDLYIEDDIFLDKRPIDIKKMKPGKKITTELGLTWDTMLRYKIVKQADVLLLMYLHRDKFTRKQLKNAWNFYEPLTLHDSSLSYNTHSIIAAELGYNKKSYDYFQQTVRLDIDDMMKNVFLGIHAANSGGTWQSVINGFCGMRPVENGIEFHPRLPVQWKEVSFKIIFQNNLFQIKAEINKIEIVLEKKLNKKDKTKIQIDKNRILVLKS